MWAGLALCVAGYVLAPKPPLVIVVDGCIGSGKSTFAQALHDRLRRWRVPVTLHLECVDRWISLGLFEMRHRNAVTNALFQLLGPLRDYLVRCHVVGGISLQERCPLSTQVFRKTDGMERYELEEMFQLVPQRTHIRICLRCPPEVCWDRLQVRGRVHENNLSYDYIESLCDNYDEFWARQISNSEEEVCVLDASDSVSANVDRVFWRLLATWFIWRATRIKGAWGIWEKCVHTRVELSF